MKIGYLITYFFPFKGGAEQNCLNLALAAKSSHEVQVFTSDRKNEEIQNTKVGNYLGIKIRRYRPLLRYRMYFVFYPKLFLDLIREDLDIVHVHGFGFVFHDIVLVIKKILQPKTRFINTPHGPVLSYENTGILEKIVKTLVRLFEKYFINWIYDDVVAVNSNQADWMQAYGIKKDRIIVLPNGLSQDDIKMSKVTIDDVSPLINEHKLTDKVLITYAGRFSYYKGVENLLEAFARLIKVNDTLVLALIGRDDGHLAIVKSYIDKLQLQDKVLIFEDVDDRTKYCLLNISEVFVLPSQWEAFGIVLLEAMVSDTAVISTTTEGGEYILKDSQSGLLYNYGDIDDLESKINLLATDYRLRNEYKQKAQIRAKTFTWTKIGKSYLKLLEKSS